MKLHCKDCGWWGVNYLSAEHPFHEGDVIHGCPECEEVNLVAACDEPGCGEPVEAGTPTPGGYRLTCNKHIPRLNS